MSFGKYDKCMYCGRKQDLWVQCVLSEPESYTCRSARCNAINTKSRAHLKNQDIKHLRKQNDKLCQELQAIKAELDALKARNQQINTASSDPNTYGYGYIW